MSIGYKASLPGDLLQEMLKVAKTLEHLGISELAWDWENAIMFIDNLCKNKNAILGGDVYRLTSDNLEPTYDSWYLNKDDKKSDEEFIRESKKRAVAYINEYHDRNGDDFYYSVVFDKMYID